MSFPTLLVGFPHLQPINHQQPACSEEGNEPSQHKNLWLGNLASLRNILIGCRFEHMVLLPRTFLPRRQSSWVIYQNHGGCFHVFQRNMLFFMLCSLRYLKLPKRSTHRPLSDVDRGVLMCCLGDLAAATTLILMSAFWMRFWGFC